MLSAIAIASIGTWASARAFAGTRVFGATLLVLCISAIASQSALEAAVACGTQVMLLYAHRVRILQSTKPPPLSREDTEVMQTRLTALTSLR